MTKTQVIKKKKMSIKLLCSYLAIILAPAVAIIVIYITMQDALLDIQKEKAQNLSNEAVVTFNKEMQQLNNISKYISSDNKLKKYLSNRVTESTEENFYDAYSLAKSYPDYAILNRFVKNIFILPENDFYLIQIPQVVPGNERGISTLGIGKEGEDAGALLDAFNNMHVQDIVFDRTLNEEGNFFALRSFEWLSERGMVVIQVESKEIRELLRSTLGMDEGLSFLTDAQGNILSFYDRLGSRRETDPTDDLPQTGSWEEYIQAKGWGENELTIYENTTDFYGWTVVTAIPRSELLSRTGTIKNAILLLCIVSILIGVAICLWYWNNSRPVMERYLRFTEKYPVPADSGKAYTSIWKNIGGVLEHAEILQDTVEKQRICARQSVLRKLLYGVYDSQQELEQELETNGISFPVELPCHVVLIDMENPMNQEIDLSMELLEECIVETLNHFLSYAYQMVVMEPFHYALVVPTGGYDTDSRKLKQLFEKINYALYSDIPVNIYTGISEMADTALAISEEYAHACRICDYAKYYRLRMPLTLGELPRHQHVVFTVEMEMQLEKAIRSGTREQLEKLMAQVKEIYLKISREGRYRPTVHNLEVVRCIVLRCLDGEECTETVNSLLDKIQKAKNVDEMEKSIYQVWKYFSDQRVQCEDKNTEKLKQDIEQKIEQEYSSPDFNLAAVADWLRVPEKKLYSDFKKMFGVSFSSYLEVLRIRYAQEQLKTGKAVKDVAADVGYGSDYSFRRAFKRVVGVTPSDYQKMH